MVLSYCRRVFICFYLFSLFIFSLDGCWVLYIYRVLGNMLGVTYEIRVRYFVFLIKIYFLESDDILGRLFRKMIVFLFFCSFYRF